MNYFDINLINKYNASGPRYTSYPTANNFKEITSAEYHKKAVLSNKSERPISIYCHIPFCASVCYYCGCQKVVTKDQTKSSVYIDALVKEIEMQSKIFSNNRAIKQMHFGGGTPTFLSGEQILFLCNKLQEFFCFTEDGEYSIEVDPRRIDEDLIESLSIARFNRISVGIQDFDLKVQKAINREQSFNETKKVIDFSRKNGFSSVSIDLIYGLPKQSRESFKGTLDKVKELLPDRISLFNYAHLPQLFMPQRRISVDDLPSPSEKIEIFQYSLEYLTSLGYRYIGMDHFALPNDPLSIAQSEGSLYRNFQGYSTHSECDIIGLGMSSIGQIDGSFFQNEKTLSGYYEYINSEQIPIIKGKIINQDDKIRRDVIMQLICNFELHFLTIEKRYSIKFLNYFSSILEKLNEMEDDGLLEFTNKSIKVLDKGKFLIRNICMTFDSYLESNQTNFSKTI